MNALKKIFNIKFTIWKDDLWTSMIDNPIRHPDKLGHAVAHFVFTFFWLIVGLPWWVVLLWDLWFNTQIEVMDGTRPRRSIFGMPVTFTTQEQYEIAVIEGFSLKDWFGGVLGMLLALDIKLLFLS